MLDKVINQSVGAQVDLLYSQSNDENSNESRLDKSLKVTANGLATLIAEFPDQEIISKLVRYFFVILCFILFCVNFFEIKYFLYFLKMLFDIFRKVCVMHLLRLIYGNKYGD